MRVCELNDCEYPINQINKALDEKIYNKKPLVKKPANLSIKTDPPWFKIRNLPNDDGLGVGLGAARQFLEEWIAFNQAGCS